ncbi:uncharacterized protein LOC133193120 [Saccostrea echinata]|uniref:uncharacterized protein LOC133193120 n=1 Tax=Saccostrea echinata TaxID=191078 RepID=UPI002A832BC3|nr:uncharacterized protein LOC133193120 [Saccostrea echinata]
MALLWWMWFISFPGVFHCYDNICETTTCKATQSSTRNGLSANKVIDRNIEQKESSCSHTEVNKTEPAWVMVDLGKEYQIRNIIIYYRDEWTFKTAWKPYRFRQYGIEVSNTSNTQQWALCYKDNTTDARTPSSIQNISCEKTARFLRIITTYDAPEDDEYEITGAILEICEIQIYGCLPGYYGHACQPCSRNCGDGSCDGRDGRCIKGCSPGYYGSSCDRSCSTNCENNTCDQSHGTCSCVRGWKPSYCNNLSEYIQLNDYKYKAIYKYS